MTENLYDRVVEHLLDECNEKKDAISVLQTKNNNLEEDNDELTKKVEYLNDELEEEKNEHAKTQMRLRIVGTECETPEESAGQLRVITAVAECYGDHVRIMMGDMNAANIKMVEEKLAVRLAKDLMEKNLVQFIIHKPGEMAGPLDGPIACGTIGAKLFVIPWDSTGPKRVEIQR